MAVALSISNHDVKLISARENVLEKWVSAPLPPDSVKDGQILQPGIVAGVINSLFKMLQLPRTRVIASISGMSFTYRLLKLPVIKPALMREAIERATQKEINVPLDELYIDWQTLKTNGSGIEVFVVGVPRSQIDSLLKTTEMTGLELSAVDLKSLALARASGLKDGLIVDFEADCFNIIILSGGIPVTLHITNPKSAKASLEDNVSHLVDELDRTISFYNITHKDFPIMPETPVLLTGELSASPAAEQMLARICTHPIRMLTTQFRTPSDFPVSSFAGNIGLILKKASAGMNSGRTEAVYSQVNVNPLRGRKRVISPHLPWRKLMLPVFMFLALLLVAGTTLFRNSSAAETAALQKEMDGITRNIFLHELALKQAEETQIAIDHLEEETSALQQELQLISGKGQLSDLLTMVLKCLPEGAVCSSLVSDQETITLDAVARQRSDVFDCARQLEEAGLFSAVRIHSIEELPAAAGELDGTARVAFEIVIER
jgi:Tfp pilus assembly protein PilN